MVTAVHRTASRSRLESRVQQAAAQARRTFEPESEILLETHVWACMATAAYEGLHDKESPHGQATARAVRNAIDMSQMLEPDPSTDPPFARLVGIAKHLAMGMALSMVPVMARARGN